MIPTWLIFLLTCLITTQAANFCTSIYLHRGLAHKALRFSKPVEAVMRIILWLTTTIDRHQWVAVHRKHHAHPDLEGDPHSPRLLGFWKVQLGNLIYYRREAHNPETIDRYTKDIPDDGLDRFCGHSALAVAGLLVLFVCLLGPIWGAAAVPVHYASYIFLGGTVNGAGHRIGYRNFENTAGNLWLTSLITSGEGLHNNHHANPGNPKFSRRWWEIDLGWWSIRVLGAMGLARPA